MASSSVLERLIVQLVGDGTSFQRMMQGAVRTTFQSARGMQSAVVGMASHVEKALDKMAHRTLQVGRILTMAVTLPMAAAGFAGVKLAADWESAAVSFEVLLGSASEAATMLDQLRAMAVVTPFDSPQLMEASKVLLNYGIAGENIMPTLSMLGDISMGNADKLHRLSIAYGQAQAAGRLMGQDLLQMINAGFNPLQEISKRTGESLAELRDRMHSGNIGTAELTRAFADAVSEGGRFHNMMERMSKTLHGRWSTLVDVTKVFLTTVGTDLMPVLKQLVEWGIQVVDWVGKLPPAMRVTIVAMAALAAAAGPVLMMVGYLSLFGAAIMALAGGVISLGPVVPIVAALAAGMVALGAALAAAVVWVVGPTSLTTAWATATAAVGDFVSKAIGFVANLQHNMGVLYKWIGENWSYVLEDMIRLLVTFAVNMGMNLLTVVETAMRIFTLWSGYMAKLWEQVFTVDMVNWVLRGIKEVRNRFMHFAIWMAGMMQDAMAGKTDPAKIAQMFADDLIAGITTGNIGEETQRVLNEQMAKLRLFEGFESSIPEGPEFRFDMPPATVVDKAKKTVEDLRGMTDEPMAVKFKISGLDALEYGSAKMAEMFEKYDKELEQLPGGRAAAVARSAIMPIPMPRPPMPVGPGERVSDTGAIGASTAGHALTARDTSGFFGGGDSERKEVLRLLERIAGHTEPKKARQAIVFQPANLKGRA